MDGAQFAKMLSDKHLFELNRMEYKYSTVSVKEFAELLRQNFAQPLPLTDFSGNKLFYLPNLAQNFNKWYTENRIESSSMSRWETNGVFFCPNSAV